MDRASGMLKKMIHQCVHFVFLWPCLANAHSQIFLINFFLSASHDVPAAHCDRHHYPRPRPARRHHHMGENATVALVVPSRTLLPYLQGNPPCFFLLYLFPPQSIYFACIRLFSAVGGSSFPARSPPGVGVPRSTCCRCVSLRRPSHLSCPLTEAHH